MLLLFSLFYYLSYLLFYSIVFTTVYKCLVGHGGKDHTAFISRTFSLTRSFHPLSRDQQRSPEQVWLLGFLRAAGEAQDLEHVREGAAIGRLGDEDRAAQEEDQEGDSQAHGGDDVAQLEAEVLLDVGHTPQGQDGSQVDAPVEPVEEPARGLRSSVFHLKPHTQWRTTAAEWECK